MSLTIKCKNCGEDIIVKFLKIGEIVECKHCGTKNEIPETASQTDKEPLTSKSPPKSLDEQTGEKERQLKRKSMKSRIARVEKEVKKLKEDLRVLEGEKITPEPVPLPVETRHEIIKERVIKKPEPVIHIKPRREIPKQMHKKWLQFERTIGERWLVWVGVLVFAVGFGIFLKYAFEQRWLNEVARSVLGFLGGLSLIGFSEFLYRKKFEPLSQGISALGIILIYLNIFTSYHFYHILQSTPAFTLFFVTTIGGMTIAMLHNALPTAFLSILGAFITPILLSDPTSTVYYEPMLFSYLLVINLGVLYVSFVKRWRMLSFVSFLFTTIYFCGWYIREYTPSDFPLAAGFTIAYFAIFSFMSMPQSIIAKKKSNLEDLILVILNPIIFFIIAHTMLTDRGANGILPYVPLGMAIYHFVLARIIRRINAKDIVLYFGFMGTAIGLLTLPVPMIVKSYWITVAWGIEALILIIVGSIIGRKPLRVGGLIVFLLVAIRLFTIDSSIRYHGVDHHLLFINLKFLALLLSSLTFGIGALLLSRLKNLSTEERTYTIPLWTLFIVGLFWIANVDMFAYFSSFTGIAGNMRWAYSTMLWSAFFCWLLVQGVLTNNRRIRIAGLYLMAATAAKILFVDIGILYSYYQHGYPFLFNLKFLSQVIFLGSIFAVAILYGKRLKKGEEFEENALWLLWSAFIGMLFLCLNFEVFSYFGQKTAGIRMMRLIFTSILWTSFSCWLLVSGIHLHNSKLRLAGLVLVGATAFKLLFVDTPLLYNYSYGYPFLLNLKFASAVVLMFTLGYTAFLYTDRGVMGVGFEKKTVPYLWSLLLVILFIEINSQATFSFYHVWSLGQQKAAFALSFLWVLYGFGLLLVGILKKILPLRISALCLFGITLCKVFFVDLRFTGKLYKIFVLLGIGVIFMIAAYFYRRYRGRLQE